MMSLPDIGAEFSLFSVPSAMRKTANRNLAYFAPNIKSKFPIIAAFLKKDRDFSSDAAAMPLFRRRECPQGPFL